MLISHYPDDACGYMLIGMSCYTNERWKDALYYFKIAFTLDADCDILAFIIDIENELKDYIGLQQYCSIRNCVNNESKPFKSNVNQKDICSIF